MKKIIIIVLLLGNIIFANEAKNIMEKLDQNMRGKNIYIKMSMKITSFGHTRTMKMKVWAKGSNKSFVKILYPPRDRGITFLNLNYQMWQYVPKIERIIKIPASMMLQNWMGSNITNDDMVKQSSLVKDYNLTILKRDNNIVFMQLLPKKDAAVVWGKIIFEIDILTFTPKKATYYDEEDKKVRVFSYENVKKIGKYYIATLWKIQPSNKKNSSTEIVIEDVKYDEEFSNNYFKKSALKRYSR